jgi:DNA-binding SARP family transcriptional activator
MSPRDRLEEIFVHVALGLGTHLETRNEWSEAATVFHEALDRAPLAEELHQHLMWCYHELGLTSLAEKTYRRLCAALEEHRGATPCPASQSLHAAVSASGPVDVTTRPPHSPFFPH